MLTKNVSVVWDAALAHIPFCQLVSRCHWWSRLQNSLLKLPEIKQLVIWLTVNQQHLTLRLWKVSRHWHTRRFNTFILRPAVVAECGLGFAQLQKHLDLLASVSLATCAVKAATEGDSLWITHPPLIQHTERLFSHCQLSNHLSRDRPITVRHRSTCVLSVKPAKMMLT